MKKKVVLLGSTGSIGKQVLDVIDWNRDKYEIMGLSANTNIELLRQQIHKYRPEKVAVVDESKGRKLKRLLDGKTEVLIGNEGMEDIIDERADIIFISVVGITALKPVIKSIKLGKRIALANKEAIVTAGGIIKKLQREHNGEIIPVDSEHCAIFQCIRQEKQGNVERLILTASGGPFFGKTTKELMTVSVEEALKHPNWSMGKKITIDSATLMNKGLEIIEASWLFGVPWNKIDVVIHPQSIIHSMVEYIDKSIIAQLGVSDMRLPISFALGYPDRKINRVKRLDLVEVGKLEFFKPDRTTFKALDYAYKALQIGGTMPTVLNAANEVAVDLFLKRKIKFTEIYEIIEGQMKRHVPVFNPSIEDIINIDRQIRNNLL
ncbi:MAG TPA: 1-deoxy-D-xylulose-5-phosphate reductoisomerase [Clostridiales bacterium]|nr:1-deoxy-D-xylulose-5-phosphate reductoisomerase [Clostridiales bacterium]